jgi:hypothetical protein
MRYVDIVFLTGDDDITDALYNVEGVVAHGMTEESIAVAIEHMLQWDYGEGEEVEYVPHDSFYAADSGGPWGSSDDIHHQTGVDGCLALSSNLGLGYAGLIRITEDCPFCEQGKESS